MVDSNLKCDVGSCACDMKQKYVLYDLLFCLLHPKVPVQDSGGKLNFCHMSSFFYRVILTNHTFKVTVQYAATIFVHMSC